MKAKRAKAKLAGARGGRIFPVSHPLLQHYLSEIRAEGTDHSVFRHRVREMGRFLAFEVSRNLPLVKRPIRTPLETMRAPFIAEDLVFIGIMRAGLGLLDGALEAFPQARAGHIGMYRSEPSLDIVEYFFKIPDLSARARVVLFDPMLATASTAVAAIQKLKSLGVEKIQFACVVASPEGLKALRSNHGDVEIFYISLDRELNDQKYILPGLGDAGDRIYGTKVNNTKR